MVAYLFCPYLVVFLPFFSFHFSIRFTKLSTMDMEPYFMEQSKFCSEEKCSMPKIKHLKILNIALTN